MYNDPHPGHYSPDSFPLDFDMSIRGGTIHVWARGIEGWYKSYEGDNQPYIINAWWSFDEDLEVLLTQKEQKLVMKEVERECKEMVLSHEL